MMEDAQLKSAPLLQQKEKNNNKKRYSSFINTITTFSHILKPYFQQSRRERNRD